MRRFIAYDSNGDIKSVLDADYIPEGLETPFILYDGEFALEVLDKALTELSIEDINRGYKVDAKVKKLVKLKATDAK